MIISESHHQKKLCAISYETATFFDLKFYLQRLHERELHRIDPDQFSASTDKDQYDFINLGTKQNLRKKNYLEHG